MEYRMGCLDTVRGCRVDIDGKTSGRCCLLTLYCLVLILAEFLQLFFVLPTRFRQ